MCEGLRVITEEVPAARRGRAVGMFINPEQNGVWGIEKSEWAIGLFLRWHYGLDILVVLCNGSRLFPFAHIVQSYTFSAYRIA